MCDTLVAAASMGVLTMRSFCLQIVAASLAFTITTLSPAIEVQAADKAVTNESSKSVPNAQGRHRGKKAENAKQAEKVVEERTAPEAEKLFSDKNWEELLKLAQPENNPDARTVSLAANGLWQQSKWADALELMDSIRGQYPASVAPYAGLLRVLALERTNMKDEARSEAKKLIAASEKFPIVEYYAMYSLFRLTDDVNEKEKLLRSMYKEPNAQKSTILRELANIGRMNNEDALTYLKSNPQSPTALKIAAKAPDSPQKFYRLGYSAYLRGDNETAVKWLSKIDFNGPYGESGTYYLGYALQRLDRSPEAEPLMEKLVYKKGTDHMIRAMFRLRLMFGGKAHDAALSALLQMTKSENTEIAHQALYSLAVSRWEKASWARDEYLRKYPTASHANALRWELGWSRYLAGDYSGAAEAWGEKVSTPQMLYWKAKALEKLGQTEKAAELRKKLLSDFTLSVYAFWANPEETFRIVDSELPKAFFAPRSDLEKWGFITHARMELEGKTDIISCVARARISHWLGKDWQVYSDLRRFVEAMLSGQTLAKPLLEIVYPRPFANIVEAQAKKWGVDPLFVWATMKHESGFNPGAANWIGANGLMQMMPGTASSEAKKMGLKRYNLFNPQDSIAMAASHISGLMKRFEGKMRCVSGAYNAGAGAVTKWNDARGDWDEDMWVESIPYAETNSYVKKVLLNYYVYKKLYADEYAKVE